ncbi:hypothetical protein J2T17_005537 [Paenibacillus mucilaginosus]|uniref:hypothetical protein n=1 Tax=Paenibacillus mucilaginosus TaxID=61624 RepID=UPI003D238F67
MLHLTLNGLAAAVYRYFSYPVLEQGWQVYAEGRIIEYTAEGALVQAYVEDDSPDWEHPNRVELNLEDLRYSTCDCHSDGYCEHMAAVMFEWCDRADYDPSKLLKSGTSALGGAGGGTSVRASSSGGEDSSWASILDSLTTARSLLPREELSVDPEAPVQGSGPASWQKYFRSRVHPNRFSSLASASALYDKVLGELLPIAAGWEKTAAQLYELHVILFVMKLTEEIQGSHFRQQYDFSYYQRMEVYRDLASRCWDHLTGLLKEIHRTEARERYDSLLQETEEVLHSYAQPASGTVVPWMQTYTALWWDLLWSEAGAAREKARLQKVSEEEELPASRAEWLMHAQLLFAMRGGTDEEAMALAGRMGHAAPAKVLPYLEVMARTRAWERLTAWLQWLVPWMTRVPGGQLGSYFDLWEQVRGVLGLDQEWRDAVFALLPRSLDYYTEELMSTGRYREWVDIHLVLGYTPMDFRASELKPIESEHRELLLPWYHHSVELFIAEKNRDAYKRAVRLLKKLQSHYKKLKRTEVWDRYLAYLTTRYSRLRALQQEMEKLRKGGDAS